ncbi:pyridoxal phosphate-dependent aminotransferase [Streptomyces sp. SID5643]|uniref:pyridoxal phosphate-dependent aminotransferase n=1 Tax=Streptomyces sp. SID5643 TaxID=2690307 RepID=UPI00192695AD|nr:pyridoxal phosphate-dependent aminotransferase [Streptomyces sp. SID5643]
MTSPMSPNLALNERVAGLRAEGRSIVHLGFGESRLPAFAPLVERLRDGARRNAYGPVAGAPEALASVSGYFGRRGLPTGPEDVMLGPGSKPLLMALNLVLPGDVLLPRPCWNSYAPQARMAGKRVHGVPIPASCGGIPDPALLGAAIAEARREGGDPRIVVLTLPDNPTGTLAGPDLVREVCAIAEAEDLMIVSDEIYRDVMHRPDAAFLSPAEVVPHRTVVTTGLSKSLAVGGWRIGALRVPPGEVGRRLRGSLTAVASDMWSTLSGPMQEVAAYAFADPPEIRARLAASARLHGAVARAVHAAAVAAGATCRPPTGAFYVYPDFEPMRQRLASRGVDDAESLGRCLLDEQGLAVLAGHLLGDDPRALRFKAATSMLYGDTDDEQEAALAAADPLALPHVADALTRVEEGLAKLGA